MPAPRRPTCSRLLRRAPAPFLTPSTNRGAQAKLRAPLCKCKGIGGRAAFINFSCAATEAAPPASANLFEPAPVATPEWAPSSERVDIKALIGTEPRPQFLDTVELYEDDLHECGSVILRTRVYMARGFWVAYIRCFVRVEGVMGRVVDTRYVHHLGSAKVLRERSWCEGPWELLVPREMESCPAGRSLEKLNDSVAAEKLPLIRPVVTEELLLPTAAAAALIPAVGGGGAGLAQVWERGELVCEALCAGGAGGLAVAVAEEGQLVCCVHPATGADVWRREAPGGVDVVSAALSVRAPHPGPPPRPPSPRHACTGRGQEALTAALTFPARVGCACRARVRTAGGWPWATRAPPCTSGAPAAARRSRASGSACRAPRACARPWSTWCGARTGGASGRRRGAGRWWPAARAASRLYWRAHCAPWAP